MPAINGEPLLSFKSRKRNKQKLHFFFNLRKVFDSWKSFCVCFSHLEDILHNSKFSHWSFETQIFPLLPLLQHQSAVWLKAVSREDAMLQSDLPMTVWSSLLTLAYWGTLSSSLLILHLSTFVRMFASTSLSSCVSALSHWHSLTPFEKCFSSLPLPQKESMPSPQRVYHSSMYQFLLFQGNSLALKKTYLYHWQKAKFMPFWTS